VAITASSPHFDLFNAFFMRKFTALEKITIALNFVVYSFLGTLLTLVVAMALDPNWFGKADAAGAPGAVAHTNYPLLIGATLVGVVAGAYFSYRYAKKLKDRKS
jgi:hypothetical protein